MIKNLKMNKNLMVSDKKKLIIFILTKKNFKDQYWNIGLSSSYFSKKF